VTAGRDPAGVTVVYAGETPPREWSASLFLAGPTPRSADVASWRPGVLAEVARQWDGREGLVVFVPEPRDGSVWPEYDGNRRWELFWGDRVDTVLFWIPRGPGLPGLTTNDEWGRWKDSGRVVLGTPPGVDRVRYQRDYAADHGVPLATTLAGTVAHALAAVTPPARRAGGRRHVPLQVWRTATFQCWLAAVEGAGNELREARQEWVHRPEPGGEVFFWALRAAVHVAAEGRVKENELVLARPDTAAVVAYRRAARPEDSPVVLVREFRTPGASPDGWVHELPGGSRPGGMADARAVAAREFTEETGLPMAPERLRAHAARQPAATVCAHRTHVFSVELAAEELAALRAAPGPHGDPAATERTYVEVTSLSALLTAPTADWATLGAVAQVLLDGEGP
jgi:8-oxo-dGTP pyrophosphatase MutT (NUDIX family)